MRNVTLETLNMLRAVHSLGQLHKHPSPLDDLHIGNRKSRAISLLPILLIRHGKNSRLCNTASSLGFGVIPALADLTRLCVDGVVLSGLQCRCFELFVVQTFLVASVSSQRLLRQRQMKTVNQIT